MKKYVTWAAIIAVVIFVIAWGLMGVKLLDGDYDIVVEAYIALACLVIIFAYGIWRLFNEKCPHCGKMRMTNGKYCSYCGKEI